MSALRGAVIACLILAAGRGEIVAGSTRPRLEIFGGHGRPGPLKLYSGESMTFRVRSEQEADGSLFGTCKCLNGVTFTLIRWPRPRQVGLGTTSMKNPKVIRTKEPESGKKDNPSFFRISNEEPGRYRLKATKPGFEGDWVDVDFASFLLIDIDARIDKAEDYFADFTVQVEDPGEKAWSIPIQVETLTRAGRILDSRDDVELVRAKPKNGRVLFRSNHRIRLSSAETVTFARRRSEAVKKPLGAGFFDLKRMKAASKGLLRISFHDIHMVYSLPLGY